MFGSGDVCPPSNSKHAHARLLAGSRVDTSRNRAVLLNNLKRTARSDNFFLPNRKTLDDYDMSA